MGINGCFIVVPSFIELTNFSKELFPDNLEMQNIIGSSFFNFSFYIADFFSPIFGSFFTSHYSFETSAYFSAVVTLCFWAIFTLFYKNKIKLFFKSKDIEENIIKEKQSNLIPMTLKSNDI